jgi:hypothetical protein
MLFEALSEQLPSSRLKQSSTPVWQQNFWQQNLATKLWQQNSGNKTPATKLRQQNSGNKTLATKLCGNKTLATKLRQQNSWQQNSVLCPPRGVGDCVGSLNEPGGSNNLRVAKSQLSQPIERVLRFEFVREVS